MTRLFIVRHGETEWNKEHRLQGKQDTALSEKGLAQAQLIAKRLSQEKIDCIYTSTLTRAKKTAQIIAEACKHQNIFEHPEIHEISLGPWEGLTIDEIKEKYSDHYKAYVETPHSFSMDGAETVNALAQRTYQAIQKIVQDNEGKNIVIVSHGAAIRAAFTRILDMDIKNYTKLSFDNASLSIIDFRESQPVIRLLNDTCHLQALL